MSLKLFHHSISNSTLITYKSSTAGLWALGGNFQNSSLPCMYFDSVEGCTYAVGYENNVTNNAVWIMKQTANSVESTKVNTGTTSSDPQNHPTPMLLMDDSGYIYVFQNKYHIDSFRYYKSDAPRDISSFTYQYDFTANASYIGLLKRDGNNCVFITRAGGVSSYSNSIVHLDLSDGTDSTVQFTDVDFAGTNVRHYPILPYKYGTSTKYIGGISHRHETLGNVYKMSLWVTSDFETFTDMDESFSKDVVATSEITDAELEANFAVLGTDADTTASYGAASLIQIDDLAFMLYKSDTNEFTIAKYEIGTGFVDDLVIPLSLNTTTSFNNLYYNGTNLVLELELDTNIDTIYTMDLDLTNFTYVKDIDTPRAYDFGLPKNLDEVDGKYMMIGRSVVGDNGNVPYIITDDKYL